MSKLCEKPGQKKISICLPFTPKQGNATKTRNSQSTSKFYRNHPTSFVSFNPLLGVQILETYFAITGTQWHELHSSEEIWVTLRWFKPDFCWASTVLYLLREGQKRTHPIFEILGYFIVHHQVSVVGRKPVITYAGPSNIF
jgi:hypothetical protein